MPTTKGVLICLDLSSVADRVLEEGANLAKALGVGAILLHVAAPEPDFIGYDNSGIYTRQRRADELRDEHATLQDLATKLTEQGTPTLPLLVKGVITQVILEQAEKHDSRLVVAGSHGHGALHRFLIGSTADALVRRCTRTLVLVPVHDED